MNAYVALLRAVNVGGTGKLAMGDLKALCERAGFLRVRTYIASGNVIFASPEAEARVKAALESSPPWSPTPAGRSACWCAPRPRWRRSSRAIRPPTPRRAGRWRSSSRSGRSTCVTARGWAGPG